MIKYKVEIVELENGDFIVIGYNWIGPYSWKQDTGILQFKSIQEVAKFLETRYK